MNINDNIKDWLNNFVDPVILHRGEDYFTEGHVVKLEKADPSTWLAVVQGSQNYEVSFEVDLEDVLSTCSCPFNGVVCKHQVAVAMAIMEDLSDDSSSEIEEEIVSDEENHLIEILDSLTIDELKNSLVRILMEDEKLYDRFMIENQSFPDDLRSIRSIVLKALRTGADHTGFIGYWQVMDSYAAIRVILDQIPPMIEQNDIMHAFQISRTVIIETIKAFEFADDSNGLLGSAIDESVDFISECVHQCPEEDEKKLFNEILKLTKNPVFHGWDWHYQLLVELPFISLTDSQRKKMESYLDELEVENQKQAYPSSFAILSILKIRHQLIELFDGYEASWEFVRKNLAVDHFRKLYIEKVINEKDFDAATQLCEEGILLAKTRYIHPLFGVIKEYRYILLDIAERQNNVMAIEKCRISLLVECNEWSMYVVLKNTVSPKIWVEKRREIWKEMEKCTRVEMLATAYDIEEQYGLLLDYCKEHRWLHSEFAISLEKNFPAYMANYYQEEVFKELETVDGGRAKYHEAAKMLKNVKRLGYTQKFHQAIKNLCEKYPNRPAMIDELRKVE